MLRRILIGMIVVIAMATIGVAWATIPSKDGTINACYGKYTGVVRIVDSSTDRCQKWETPISWNQAGPSGPKGTSTAIHAQLADEVAIPTSNTTFLRLALREGYYSLSGTVQVFNLGAAGRVPVVCQLDTPGGAMAFSAGVATAGLAPYSSVGGGDNVTLPLNGVVAFAESVNWIEIRCLSNTGDPSKTAMIGHRQLTAVQVDDIEFQDGTSGAGGD